MGMTDAQWKSYLRALIREMERALELTPDNHVLQGMINELHKDLQG